MMSEPEVGGSEPEVGERRRTVSVLHRLQLYIQRSRSSNPEEGVSNLAIASVIFLPTPVVAASYIVGLHR